MQFIPDYKLNILDENDYASQMELLENKLAQCRNEGFFTAFDGKKIFYEYFLAKNSTASVVIVHGLSEFTKKFYEFAYYLLNAGYNVFLYDQRCHGKSERLTDDNELIHINSFNDYVADLDAFVENIVLKVSDKPINIYCHSMGGAVTALYLSKKSERIKKAIFTSPMIEPLVKNAPVPLAKLFMTYQMIFLDKSSKWQFCEPFDPSVTFSRSGDSSEARFKYNFSMRLSDPNYRTTPMSISWVYGSLMVKGKIFRKNLIKRIKTPILLFSAEKDTVVSNKAQIDFAKRCETCEVVRVKNAKHSILTSGSKELEEHIKRVIDFFE